MAFLWKLMNGQKLNTGMIVTIAAIIIQNLFNVGHDEAVSIVTNVMMGVGGVTALIGYIHKLIKARKPK